MRFYAKATNLLPSFLHLFLRCFLSIKVCLRGAHGRSRALFIDDEVSGSSRGRILPLWWLTCFNNLLKLVLIHSFSYLSSSLFVTLPKVVHLSLSVLKRVITV